MVCSNALKKLRGNIDCLTCYNRSFKANPKHKMLVDKNINPLLFCTLSSKKCDFYCTECNHIYNMTIQNVSKGNLCSFCTNKKLCENQECISCRNNIINNCTTK